MERKLAAILSTGMEGYSLMGDDEQVIIRILTAYSKILTSLIQEHCVTISWSSLSLRWM